jgi:predicted nucleic acid-binding Zn ribbon protein
VADLLPKILDEVGLGGASDAIRLLHAWDAALGAPNAVHCRPEGLRGGTAWGRVRDSAWMQRVQLDKPRILARLAEALGPGVVRDLRLRIGPVDDPAPSGSRGSPDRSGSSG